MDWDVARAERLDREQAVVDRAERGAGADDDGDLPLREEVGVEGRARDGDERAARAFDDQVAGGWGERFVVYVNVVNFGGEMRRGGGDEAVGFGADRHAGEAGDDFAVGFLFEARLDRFPVGCAGSL